MPAIEQMKKGYAHLWDEAVVTKEGAAEAVAERILANKPRYLQVEQDTGVPWIMAGVIHMRESDLDFKTHMHNGDSLRDYTHHVPANRPKVGHGPPFTFEESTDDAFTLEGFDKLRGQYTIELMLFSVEGFNGWGYLKYGNSPYVWAWTSEYHGGKFIRDGVYDADHWDEQPGCAAILKTLATMDESAKIWVGRRMVAGQTIPDVAMKQATRKERGAAQGGAVGTAAGTGTVASNPKTPGTKVITTFAGGTIAMIGVAVVVVAVVLLYRKTQLLKQRMFGGT